MSRSGPGSLLVLAAIGALLLGPAATAHHPTLAKFDDDQPLALSGRVTYVDWRNPHVHVLMNVQNDSGATVNWAVELDSMLDLRRSGWDHDTLEPGVPIEVEGIRARDGSRQLRGERVVRTDTGQRVLYSKPWEPFRPMHARPVPRWDDGRPRLGMVPGGPDGYWAHPTRSYLIEDGVDVEMRDGSGLLLDIADAGRVAPMQPWAEALYRERQRRHLQDDPMYLQCKPPGGPRQFQLSQGVQFLEDRNRERVFVLMGGGNRNHRLIYNDERAFVGQVGGDDDNPLYYGRARGHWEDDTYVVETRGFNEDFWFTSGGLPHTSHLRLSERFTRVDHDTLEYQVTVDDRGAYTRPWTASWTLHWVSGEDLPFYLCQDNRP